MKVFVCFDGDDIETIKDSKEKAEKWLENKNDTAKKEGMLQAWFCCYIEMEVE